MGTNKQLSPAIIKTRQYKRWILQPHLRLPLLSSLTDLLRCLPSLEAPYRPEYARPHQCLRINGAVSSVKTTPRDKNILLSTKNHGKFLLFVLLGMITVATRMKYHHFPCRNLWSNKRYSSSSIFIIATNRIQVAFIKKNESRLW